MTTAARPLFLYNTLTVSFVILFTSPGLTAPCIFLESIADGVLTSLRSGGAGDAFHGNSSSGFSVVNNTSSHSCRTSGLRNAQFSWKIARLPSRLWPLEMETLASSCRWPL